MTRRLLFFTIHYPRGIAELWKYDDICAMAAYFDEVVVVPTEATSPLLVDREHPKNVRFEKPILAAETAGPSRLRGMNGAQLAELCRQILTLDRRRVASCLRSISFQDRFLSECQRRGLFDSDFDETFLFFFWARGAAEILAALPEGVAEHVMVGMHGFDLYEGRVPSRYLPFRRSILQHSDVLAPCSEHGAAYLRQRYPGFGDRIKVKRLGVVDFGESPHVADGPLKIISVAFANPVKRLDRIIPVLAMMRCEFVWTHVGDGPELLRLKHAAAELFSGPGQRVEFLGQMSADEVRHRLVSHPYDIFLSFSQSEGVPVSIMEALSAGIPVLATDAGGTRELVEEDWLLPVEFDLAHAVSKIEAFVALPATIREEIRRRARQRAEDRARAPHVNRGFAESIYGRSKGMKDKS